MNTPFPSRWDELFDQAVSLLDQSRQMFGVPIAWTFGGGTALMLQIWHRESHDIDLFIDDPQWLPFLNPEAQGYQLGLAPSGYETDGSRSLKIVFDGIGEIDIICCPALLPVASTVADIRGRQVDLESPAEILAKKVVHRGKRLQPRDMFDLAAVGRRMGKDYVGKALEEFPESVAHALAVAEGTDHETVRAVLGDLIVRPDFRDLVKEAQREAVDILRSVPTPGRRGIAN